MSSRVSYSNISSKRKSSRRGSFPVVTRQLLPDPTAVLQEVHAGKTWSTVTEWAEYARVLTSDLNLKMLNRLFTKENAKSFGVGETMNYFWYQYKDRPRMYISKVNGKVMAAKYGEMESYSALVMLRILNKYGLVVDFKRVQKGPTWNIGF